jgi:hypothetical protein
MEVERIVREQKPLGSNGSSVACCSGRVGGVGPTCGLAGEHLRKVTAQETEGHGKIIL